MDLTGNQTYERALGQSNIIPITQLIITATSAQQLAYACVPFDVASPLQRFSNHKAYTSYEDKDKNKNITVRPNIFPPECQSKSGHA